MVVLRNLFGINISMFIEKLTPKKVTE